MDDILHGILDRFYADKRNWKKHGGNKENAFSQAIQELRTLMSKPCQVTGCTRTIQEVQEYQSKLGVTVRVGLCQPHFTGVEKAVYINGEDRTKTQD